MPSLLSVSNAPDGNVISVPRSAALPFTAVTLRLSPSASLSAPLPLSTNTLPLIAVSSSVVSLSSWARGGFGMSRKSRSVSSGTALEPSAFKAGTALRLKLVNSPSAPPSSPIIFLSLTSKPSVTFVSSKTLNRPSPSVSVKSVDGPVAGVVPRPASNVSFRPSLSESVSR